MALFVWHIAAGLVVNGMEAPAKVEKTGIVRNALGRFVSGTTGNPTGRRKIPEEVREILFTATPSAARRLVEIAQGKNEKTALQAISLLLDRVYGKPTERAQVEVAASGAVDIRAEIRAALLGQRLLDSPLNAIDCEAECTPAALNAPVERPDAPQGSDGGTEKGTANGAPEKKTAQDARERPQERAKGARP